jgi:hypothetical protein
MSKMVEKFGSGKMNARVSGDHDSEMIEAAPALTT